MTLSFDTHTFAPSPRHAPEPGDLQADILST